jgi:hypothetical protein|tara:strand:+ start:276 stop:662 length:387 start_codon:yes stop_codon:yes gene_type:complete
MFVDSFAQYIQKVTNAKLDVTGTGVTTLYTAPTAASFVIINSILVSEDTGNADTLTVTLTNGSSVFSLFKTAAIGANGTVELLLKDLVLQPTEILKVTAATGNRLHVVAGVQEFVRSVAGRVPQYNNY